jgi:hypothetical protein
MKKDIKFKGREIPARESKRKSLFFKFEVFNTSDQLIGYLGDITLNGLKVISKESMPLNTNLNLKIKLPPRIHGKEEIIFQAECVWCKKDSNNNDYQLGFKAHHQNEDNINTIKIIMELLASPEDLIL